jgi:redox-regulated HSP33 family molecular chaperone
MRKISTCDKKKQKLITERHNRNLRKGKVLVQLSTNEMQSIREQDRRHNVHCFVCLTKYPD